MGKWAGQPNYFVERILNSIKTANVVEPGIVDVNGLERVGYIFNAKHYNIAKPKLHTIRAGNRWEAGMDIHFAINPRSKNYFQFAPVIPCVSVQEIEIIHTGYSPNTPAVYVSNGKSLMNPLSYSEIETLAQNDGFDSVEQFFAWFNKDFKGQLIHWSDLRY